MADKIKKTEESVNVPKTEEMIAAPKAPKAPKTEYVEMRVPLKDKETTMFVGVNFKNYILKRGEWVRVPKAVAEVIRNSEIAEESAKAYAQAKEEAYFERAANPTIH